MGFKTGMMGLSGQEKFKDMISLAIVIQYTSVTDGQTPAVASTAFEHSITP